MPLAPLENIRLRERVKPIVPIRLSITFPFPRKRGAGAAAPQDFLVANPPPSSPGDPGVVPGAPVVGAAPPVVEGAAPAPAPVVAAPPAPVVAAPAPTAPVVPLIQQDLVRPRYPVMVNFTVSANEVHSNIIQAIPFPWRIRDMSWTTSPSTSINARMFIYLARSFLAYKSTTMPDYDEFPADIPAGWSIIYPVVAVTPDTNESALPRVVGLLTSFGGQSTTGYVPLTSQVYEAGTGIAIVVAQPAAGTGSYQVTLTIEDVSDVPPAEVVVAPPASAPSVPTPTDPSVSPVTTPSTTVSRTSYTYQAQIPASGIFGSIGDYPSALDQYNLYLSLWAYNGKVVQIMRLPDNVVVLSSTSTATPPPPVLIGYPQF